MADNLFTATKGSVTIDGQTTPVDFVHVPGIKKPVLRAGGLPFVVEDTPLREAHVATAMSTVDGEGDGVEGKLLYRGYNIKELVEKAGYEEVAYLLLRGQLPTQDKLSEFTAKLREKAVIEPSLQQQLKSAIAGIEINEQTNPVSLMSALVSIMDVHENLPTHNEEARYESTLRTIAAMPSLIGLVNAKLQGTLDNYSFVDPNTLADEHFYANLTMASLNPEAAKDAAKVAAMEKYLILHSEHGLNLSTTIARAVDSGESKEGAWRTTLGAMQGLAGNRHGNASNDALSNLKNILEYPGDNVAAKVDAYIADVDAAKKAKAKSEKYIGKTGLEMDGTIEGLGHKIYQAKDPRASALQGILKTCNANSELLQVALTLEAKLAEHPGFGKKKETAIAAAGSDESKLAKAKATKNIFPNVDFCSGVMLTEYLGVDERLMTSMFAVGRNVGWQAHAAENARHARNITRPEAIPLTPEVTDPIPAIADRTAPPTNVIAAVGQELFKAFKSVAATVAA